MKKITLLALLLSLATAWQTARGQAITIAAARALAPTANNVAGPSVTVRGIVTNGDELGSTQSVIRYIQDSTAGIAVYSPTNGPIATSLNSLVRGDSIIVTGGLKMFRGLLEVDPITSLTVLAGNRPLPAPVVFTAANAAQAYAEQYESQLVRINGLTSINTNGGQTVSAFAANTTYRLNNQASLPTYVPANAGGPDGLLNKPSPTGTFDAIGIVSQYTSSPTGTRGGYQLLNRKYADFIQGTTPNLTSSPVPTNLSTTGFTVSFNTQNPGDTRLSYATAPTATAPTGPYLNVTGSPALTTSHSQTLTGLTPGTIYYVQAVSVNATGRSESRVVPMITASLSSGRIRNYFTNSVDVSLALPGNVAVAVTGGVIADTLARYIGRATRTLDISIYNWNNTVIRDAVNSAQARGVRVRVLYEDDNANVSVGQLVAGIPKVARPARPGSMGTAIMHNKFVIIDAEDPNPNVPWVWTGSMNWTSGQLSTDPNNVIAVQDQGLARVYTVEFEEMWGSRTATPGVSLFGSRKTDNTPHHLLIGGRHVESYFSPTDNVNSRLLGVIASADNDLHVASMLVTRADLARAIASQLTTRGIAACSDGIVNDTTTGQVNGTGPAGFAFRQMKPGFAPGRLIIKRTGAGFGIMHHKTLIVDAGASLSDPTVFVGSHNWTNSADTENDENTLVVHDAQVTNRYFQEYAARIAAQNQGFTVCRLSLATRAGTVQTSPVEAYPNPNAGSFRLHLPGPAAARTATVVLRDATGRVVLERTQPLTSGNDLSVDATTLKAGLYLVQITTPESVQTTRVVVE